LSGQDSFPAGRRGKIRDFSRISKLLILGAVGSVLLSVWCLSLHVLVLRDTRGGRWVFGRIVSTGDEFTLSYTHSVKMKPVWDFYIVGEHHQIIQNKTIFPDSDFGLPSRAVGKESYSLLPDGNGCISGMQRLIPSLFLRVERAYNNTFVFNETVTINLSQKLGDCVIDMHISKMNPFEYIFQVIKLYWE
jgi:hypothetical protein